MAMGIHRDHYTGKTAMTGLVAAYGSALLLLWGWCMPGLADEAPWIRVDTRAGMITVLQGDRVLQTFGGISIGRGGVAESRRRGDRTTPLGEFRIAWVKEQGGAFRRFYAFDFPRREDALRAWHDGRIDEAAYRSILRAHASGVPPPQDTPLGGYLGIHGLGDADPWVHRHFHWTEGCIALTNEQIDRLGQWMADGTRVVVE